MLCNDILPWIQGRGTSTQTPPCDTEADWTMTQNQDGTLPWTPLLYKSIRELVAGINHRSMAAIIHFCNASLTVSTEVLGLTI